jgi:uncharacterized repeat protein (TIGR01451 family)
MNRWQRTGCTALALVLLTAPATAQQNGRPKALTITAVNVTAEEQSRDEVLANSLDAAAVYPGDVVRYRLVFTNVTEVPVRNVEFTDAIPTGLIYRIDSSTSDTGPVVVEFSIDGGSSYHADPLVERVVNGNRIWEPAGAELYTHIRWRVQEWVQPGEQVAVEFRAALPDNSERHNASRSTGRDG